KILEADIDVVTYGFYKDRFEEVHIHFRSYCNFAKLRKILFWAYGTGHQPNRSLEKYYWYGDRVFRFLTYDRISGKGVIGYIFKPICKEEQEDRKLIQERYKEMVGYFKNVKKYGSKLVG
ncbi:hypothetical protein GTN42_05875, partial [bacterium]|nr:hypothetical protein [bacterium]NIO18954.1 hypothetical protein [bacterium]